MRIMESFILFLQRIARKELSGFRLSRLLTIGSMVLVTGCLLGFSAWGALAQTSSAMKGIVGSWHGVLGGKLHLTLTIRPTPAGGHVGVLHSAEQGISLPVDSISVRGLNVRFEVKAVGGVYEGTMNEDGSKLVGTWTQAGVSQPLSLTRGKGKASAEASSSPPTPKQKPWGVPLEVTVPVAPWAFRGRDGAIHLVYELHIANMSPWACTLTRADVLSGDSTSPSLASFSKTDLEGMMRQWGSATALSSTIAPGKIAVVFMWVTVKRPEEVPKAIRHRLSVSMGNYQETLLTNSLSVNRRPPIVIRPPLRGDNWLAANGPSSTSQHRRALIPLDGRSWISQRFAIDWVRLFPDGKTYRGDRKDNRSYRSFGAEIHAVANGVVTAVKDGIPLNTPGIHSRAVPITLETIGGNHVIERIAPGIYAFYAHMQPGSLRVHLGEKVRSGQVLGLVGNTGNSTEPHLHFDLCNANSMLACSGLPYVFASFDVQGHGWGWKSSTSSQPAVKHTMELPLENDVVRFP